MLEKLLNLHSLQQQIYRCFPLPVHQHVRMRAFVTTPNLSNNVSGEESIVIEDLTPSASTTPCGPQNIALDGKTDISKDLFLPLTPIVNSGTQSNLGSIVPGGNSLAMNNPTYHNLDVPQFLSFSDPILSFISNSKRP